VTHVDIERVSQILREVGAAEVMSRWRQLADADISYKANAGGIVTVADNAAEAALERRLVELLPGSHAVGEEAVAADPTRLGLFMRDELVWVIDPIDGTRAFSKGREDFDMMIALVAGGVPVAGWIYHPVSGEIYAGERGSGVVVARADGSRERIAARGRTELRQLTGILRQDWPRSDPRRGMSESVGRFARLVAPTSSGRNYVRILRGDADFLINFSIKAWDHLPGLAMLAELGFHYGRADDTRYIPGFHGAPLLSAPSPALWTEIRDLLLTPLLPGGTVSP
jgi:fructose-1,6-bisphosphatase/inositol monophosphatase family enzyme